MSDLIGSPVDRFSHIEAHLYSVNKEADRQCCHRTADLYLCFCTHLKQVFSWCDSFSTIPTLLSPITTLSFMNLRLRMLFFFLLVIYLSIYLFLSHPLFYFYFYVIFNYLPIYLFLFLILILFSIYIYFNLFIYLFIFFNYLVYLFIN